MLTTESWLMPGSLPADEDADVVNAIGHIDAGTTPPWLHPQSRGIFARLYRNWASSNGDALPGTPGSGGYVEYDVAAPVGVTTRGQRRIVQETATGKLYYTQIVLHQHPLRRCGTAFVLAHPLIEKILR